MKIILLFPPPGNLSQPYTSLPALTAFMRREGYEVVQRDLGIEVVKDLLATKQLRRVAARVLTRLETLKNLEEPTRLEEDEREALHRAVVSADYVSHQIEEAKRALRSPVEFFDFDRFRWAANILGLAMDLLSARFWPSRFSFNHGFTNYVMPHYAWSASDLLAATKDERQNVFLNYFANIIVPSILVETPELVGISATYPGQIIPSLTLAQLLKAARPDLHICLGGAALAGMREELLRCPSIFTAIDSIVVCEGEHALLSLARALEGEDDLSAVPNLLYLDGDRVRFTSLYIEDINALPSPDYGGLPLDFYLTPEITVLLPTERGCYWGRCAFCTISTGMRHSYRPRKIELVVEDMKSLNQQLGTRCFFLSTDAISPARMKALARAISDEGLNFHWQTEARLEKALTPETCKTLAQGGCRHLRMGLESGSQQVLDAMDKGLRVEDAARITRHCHKAGISVHLCLILGFPSETRAQARETLAFIEANREAISSLTYALFALYKGSRVYDEPQRYGITSMQLPPDDWLNGNIYSYEVSRGMAWDEVAGEAYPEGVQSLSRSLPFALPLIGCFMAAAHPLHFFTQWAYLPYLVHYGVNHYRELPFAVCSPWPSNVEQALHLKPVLNEEILSRNGNNHVLTLFNPQRGVIFSLEQEASALLSLCNGQSTVRQVVEQFSADRRGVDLVKTYFRGLQLCTKLLQERFLKVINGEDKEQ